MTKFVKCIDNSGYEKYLTKGKIYEVNDNLNYYYNINTDNGGQIVACYKTRFEEVKKTNKFRFIPKSEITEVTVDGIEGILIKE